MPTTSAPSERNRSAAAHPMPEPTPLMIAVWFRSRPIFSLVRPRKSSISGIADGSWMKNMWPPS